MNVTAIASVKWRIFMERTPTQIAVETSAFILVGVISIVGNLLVILSVCRNRSLRTSTNYLAVSLAITDLLYPITVVPLSVYWLIELKGDRSQLQYEQELCDFQTICFFTLINASGYTMTLMAFNRFICVCKTEKYKYFFSKKKTVIINCIFWALCCTVAILLVKGHFFYAKFFPQQVMCSISRRVKSKTTKIIGNMLNVGSILIPYAVILYCYIRILLKIRDHKKNVRQAATANRATFGAQEIKITWTLFAVLIGYLVLWLPVAVVGVWSSYNKGLSHSISMIVPICMSSSSATNPIIYGTMNPAFRKEYKKIARSITSSTSHFFSRSWRIPSSTAQRSQGETIEMKNVEK